MGTPGKPSIGSVELRDVSAKLADARRKLSRHEAGHVLTIEEQLAALQRGDWESMLRQASPDVQFEIFAPPEFPFITAASGIDGFREAVRHNFSLVEDQRPTITNVVVQGSVVVLFGTEKGRIRATQAPYHVEFVHRFTFEDNALAAIRIIVARAT